MPLINKDGKKIKLKPGKYSGEKINKILKHGVTDEEADLKRRVNKRRKKNKVARLTRRQNRRRKK